jgi:hypothetical protein
MRRLVTGVDNQGRSCVVSEAEVAFAVRHGIVSTEQLFPTEELPPSARPMGKSDKLDPWRSTRTGLVRRSLGGGQRLTHASHRHDRSRRRVESWWMTHDSTSGRSRPSHYDCAA